VSKAKALLTLLAGDVKQEIELKPVRKRLEARAASKSALARKRSL